MLHLKGGDPRGHMISATPPPPYWYSDVQPKCFLTVHIARIQASGRGLFSLSAGAQHENDLKPPSVEQCVTFKGSAWPANTAVACLVSEFNTL